MGDRVGLLGQVELDAGDLRQRPPQYAANPGAADLVKQLPSDAGKFVSGQRNGPVPTELDRHRPAATRLHGIGPVAAPLLPSQPACHGGQDDHGPQRMVADRLQSSWQRDALTRFGGRQVDRHADQAG
jgi:hypothetical protein